MLAFAGEILERFLREHARHDSVHPTFEYSCAMSLHRFALPEMRECVVEINRRPPRLAMPTSKVTRVRNDGFSNINASNLPASAVRDTFPAAI